MAKTSEFWDSNANAWNDQVNDQDNYFTRRTSLIHDLIVGMISPGKALDVGCGPGLLSTKLAEAGFDVYGCDISKKMIAYAIEKASLAINNPESHFKVSENGEIPFDFKFDVITALGVFPYVPNHEEFLKTLLAKTENGGFIIASCNSRVSLYVFLVIVRHFLTVRPGLYWLRTLVNLIRTGM